MSRANKAIAYIAIEALALALMLVFVWNHAANGDALWAVVFAILASLNAALAGADVVVWLTERNEQ